MNKLFYGVGALLLFAAISPGCKEDGENGTDWNGTAPVIQVTGDVDTINDLKVNDIASISGTITSEDDLAGVFYYIRNRIPETGYISESPAQVALDEDDLKNATFTIQATVNSRNFIGFRIEAVTKKRGRAQKIITTIVPEVFIDLSITSATSIPTLPGLLHRITATIETQNTVGDCYYQIKTPLGVEATKYPLTAVDKQLNFVTIPTTANTSGFVITAEDELGHVATQTVTTIQQTLPTMSVGTAFDTYTFDLSSSVTDLCYFSDTRAPYVLNKETVEADSGRSLAFHLACTYVSDGSSSNGIGVTTMGGATVAASVNNHLYVSNSALMGMTDVDIKAQYTTAQIIAASADFRSNQVHHGAGFTANGMRDSLIKSYGNAENTPAAVSTNPSAGKTTWEQYLWTTLTDGPEAVRCLQALPNSSSSILRYSNMSGGNLFFLVRLHTLGTGTQRRGIVRVVTAPSNVLSGYSSIGAASIVNQKGSFVLKLAKAGTQYKN